MGVGVPFEDELELGVSLIGFGLFKVNYYKINL